jgi:hypothetical protein
MHRITRKRNDVMNESRPVAGQAMLLSNMI